MKATTTKILFWVLLGMGLAQPLLAKTTILFLGDSLTAGYGVGKEEAYPSLIDQKLKAKGALDIQIINGSISGSTTASAYSRLKWYQRIKPTILVLALGANDGLRGLSLTDMEAHLAKTIRLAKQLNMKIILAGMRLPPNYGLHYTQNFEQVFKTLADKHQITLIPFLLKDVAGRPHLNLADGLHPNPEGHAIIAQNVFPYIWKTL